MVLLAALSLSLPVAASAASAGPRAPAPSTPAAPAARVDEPVEPRGSTSSEDTDHVRVGALAGLGLPRPLAIEALVKLERVVGLGLEYSVLPSLNIMGVSTTFWAAAADLRVFPFRSAFFVGMRAGYQRLGASTTLTVASLGSVTESVTATSWFLNPRVGFLWTWASGFTIGVDAGVQLPVSTAMETTLPQGLLTELDANINRVANTLGHEPTPTVDLIRLGFLF